jgi:hypothetical protein
MNWFITIFCANWKTNLSAAVVFVLSVPAIVTAFTDWAHHQPADWRGAFAGLVISIGLAVAKDSSTHSTVAQVEAATDQASAK